MTRDRIVFARDGAWFAALEHEDGTIARELGPFATFDEADKAPARPPPNMRLVPRQVPRR